MFKIEIADNGKIFILSDIKTFSKDLYEIKRVVSQLGVGKDEDKAVIDRSKKTSKNQYKKVTRIADKIRKMKPGRYRSWMPSRPDHPGFISSYLNERVSHQVLLLALSVLQEEGFIKKVNSSGKPSITGPFWVIEE